MKTQTAQTEHKETQKERRMRLLDAHYARCEALARALGHPNPNGKKISVALWKLEKEAHDSATAQCNGERYNGQPFRSYDKESQQAPGLSEWGYYVDSVKGQISRLLGDVPPGFFVNADARGYALKIDPDRHANARKLISDCGMHTDWGGYGILSPEIQ